MYLRPDPRTGPPPPRPAGEQVLVLDDSAAQRNMMCALLRRWGHRPIPCGDPVEALTIAREAQVRLILSDWMMPGMTGPEFCRRLRAEAGEEYAYVLLLTSKSDRADLAEGLAAGADDFLTKPVHATELRARLAAGGRIIAMQREVEDKHHLLARAMRDLQVAHTAINRDLDEARKLQLSLLQDGFRRFDGAEVSLWLQASGPVGGDMVGFFPVGDNQIGLYSLDVSGHGVASAIIAARIAGMLSEASPDQNIALSRVSDGIFESVPPHLAAARLNTLMLAEMQTDRYFTLCLAIFDPSAGVLRLVQAGHPPAIVLRADNRVELVGKGGLPVGLVPEAIYETVELRLHPGDRVLFYSDGLTECTDAEGQALEEEGLAEIMIGEGALRGPALLDALHRRLVAHTGRADFADDLSALLLEVPIVHAA